MDFLLDPNVAYLVLLAGALLSLMAILTPGSGFIEVAAVLLLALGVYAINHLQTSLWALALLVLSLAPFVYSLRRDRNSIALAMAVLMLVVGSVFLFVTDDGSPAVNPTVALGASVVVSGTLWLAVRKSLQAAHARPVHDLSALVGQIGESRTEIHEAGSAQVAGEQWSARSDHKIPAGRPVRVISREGFVLVVTEVDSSNPG